MGLLGQFWFINGQIASTKGHDGDGESFKNEDAKENVSVGGTWRGQGAHGESQHTSREITLPLREWRRGAQNCRCSQVWFRSSWAQTKKLENKTGGCEGFMKDFIKVGKLKVDGFPSVSSCIQIHIPGVFFPPQGKNQWTELLTWFTFMFSLEG